MWLHFYSPLGVGDFDKCGHIAELQGLTRLLKGQQASDSHTEIDSYTVWPHCSALQEAPGVSNTCRLRVLHSSCLVIGAQSVAFLGLWLTKSSRMVHCDSCNTPWLADSDQLELIMSLTCFLSYSVQSESLLWKITTSGDFLTLAKSVSIRVTWVNICTGGVDWQGDTFWWV